MHRNQSVDVHKFSMVPRADVPRSSFKIQHTHKTTIDASKIYPIYCEEILPGDTWRVHATVFGRLATPLFPIMDNLHLETFYFFVPNRLVWDNWKKFNGEQDSPGDSVSFSIPQIVSPVGGYDPLSLFDYFGLPTVGQVDPTGTITHSALPLRAYSLIYNEWFRDQNLANPRLVAKDDGPDPVANYGLVVRGKRHDYFTSALPWPQKGDSVSLPLGTSARVFGDGGPGIGFNPTMFSSGGGLSTSIVADGVDSNLQFGSGIQNAGTMGWSNVDQGLYADLSNATAATINQLRQSFQVQKLLERDARGGTRYTEIVRAHFGVVSPDARLQRPEYLGGSHQTIAINPVAQTSGTAGVGAYTDTPQGNLAGIGTTLGQNGFTQSFTEHGFVIGLVNVRADLTYQQGLRRMWSRQTRYDFYWPAFAMLGEQAILQKEIYVTGIPLEDDAVFGFNERWAEYRYHPSHITGLFRSTSAGTIDAWHLSQNFTAPPTLNTQFIDENVPLERVLAVGPEALGQQLIIDSFFNVTAVRPLPMYSVPGLIDHF